MMHRIFFAFIWIIGRVLLWIYRVDVKGLENLPKHSVLLCPNHSTDLDPVLIGLCLPLDYHLHFMAKAELFDNRALAWLIRTLGAFPVQRDGKDIQSIKTAMQVLHKGENLLIFPEGTTIRGGVRGKDIFVLDKDGYVEALLKKKASLKRPSSREVFEEHEAEIRQGDYAR